MTSKTIRVVARLIAKSDRIGETLEALKALVVPTRAEDGCILYELTQNNADPTDFTFVEEWTSDADLETHLRSEHIRYLQSREDDLLAEPPDIRRYTLVA
ncbi:MAG: putative quinol monooxygenase [Pyrinomonadaceae bacterium]